MAQFRSVQQWHSFFALHDMQQESFFVVGVGASAGGQLALNDFFSAIPTDVNAAFVVITHLLRTHKTELPRIVSRFTSLPVERIRTGTRLERGHVYVMPENVEVTLNGETLYLHHRPSEKIVNTAIDVFFESLATNYGHRAIGVILSGLGTDGSNGAVHIFNHGGEVLIQDPSSTIFSGMPIAAILKDHPYKILSPRQLGESLVKRLSGETEDVQRNMERHKGKDLH